MKLAALRKFLLHTGLFLAGLVIGALLFAPWDQLWTRALVLAAGRLPVSMSWRQVDGASATSVRVKGLAFATPKGMVEFSEARLSLGLSPLVRLSLRTGSQVFDVSASLGGDVRLGGGVDVGALLPGRNMDGGLSLSGALHFDTWKRPPSSGTLAASASTLVLPNAMRVEQMQLAADLKGSDLTLRSFTLDKPVPMEAAGTVALNFRRLADSEVNVTGTAKVGPTGTKFKKQGTLGSLL
ncbi:MAG: hypothetical protein H0S85_03945 [Desulfovibrionaceae bacterium]|jgi:hypothetical protein|nr:hypothetical protein [Desulfovibrionaceae bacterium]